MVVEADAGCKCEQAGGDAGAEVVWRAGAVAFECQEVSAGSEDRFDSLPDRRAPALATRPKLARDYGVAHSSLSRYFARPVVVKQVKQAEQLHSLPDGSARPVAECGKCDVLLVSSRATGRLLLGLAAWSGSGSSVYS